jgi:hypothetical protein
MFDPYHRWLAIPRDQRPPTYYQLLGIARDETDREVIEEAALRQTSHVRTYQTGPYAQQCQTLLNEIGQAKVTLLHPQKRREYDTHLGETIQVCNRQPPTEACDDRASQVPSDVSIPEPIAVPFDFSVQGSEGSPVVADLVGHTYRTAPLVLVYAVLLLLEGMLAFWLSFTGPWPPLPLP